ncbi:unnamed protein product [Nippostrongylus brasiliensis]|uniref:FABP domain-containing protein n=1 Tax=Nippostrongylus brasiliensis TaxID=27835 RepID=A0A158QZU9_NIPBR|nr:unnamed protein product [Nippostrongylus brasiliensis]
MIALPVFLLLTFTTTTNGQFFDLDFPRITWNPFSDDFPSLIPSFPQFPSVFFDDWGFEAMMKRFRDMFGRMSEKSGIQTVNGTTIITQTIGGKTYVGTVPKNTSYFLSSSTKNINGTVTQVVKIQVGNETYVYETADGKTKLTDGKGSSLPLDSGFFKLKEETETTSEPKTEKETTEEESVTERSEETNKIQE